MVRVLNWKTGGKERKEERDRDGRRRSSIRKTIQFQAKLHYVRYMVCLSREISATAHNENVNYLSLFSAWNFLI